MRLRLLLPVFALPLLTASVAANPIERLVIFGDSLSDNGNVFSRTGGLFPGQGVFGGNYTQGRLTSGPDSVPPATNYTGVWHEQLAAMLGIPPATPSTGGGDSWAFGAAVTGGGTQNILGITLENVGLQVDDYLMQGNVAANAPHIFMAGGNDLFNAASATGASPADVAAAAAADQARLNIASYISQLAQAGVDRFVWANIPPLGLTPAAQSLGATLQQALEQSTAAYRDDVNAEATALQAALREDGMQIDIDVLDLHGLFLDLVEDPAAYGLVNVNTPAQGAAVDPDEYLFWDDLHPTAKGHALLAEAAFAVIPEPVSAVLMLLAFGLGLRVTPRRQVSRATSP